VFPALVLMMTLWSGAAYPGVSVATRRLGNTGALATFVALLATLVAAFFPHGTISDPVAITADPAAAKASADPGDWEVLRPQCRRHALCAVRADHPGQREPAAGGVDLSHRSPHHRLRHGRGRKPRCRSAPRCTRARRKTW
jgi:hypothetical protein